MKKLLFLFIILSALQVNGQNGDVRGKRIIADQSLLLNGARVDSVTNDTTGISGKTKTLLTADGVYKLVVGKIAAIPGGGSGIYQDTTYIRNDSLFGRKYGFEFVIGRIVDTSAGATHLATQNFVLTNTLNGSGTSGQVAFWNGTNSLTSNTSFKYSSGILTLTNSFWSIAGGFILGPGSTSSDSLIWAMVPHNITGTANDLSFIPYDHTGVFYGTPPFMLLRSGTIQMAEISNYYANYGSSFSARSLVDKNYVDSAITSHESGSSTLSGLTDANISLPSNLQLLQYQTSDNRWHNWTPNYLSSVDTSNITNFYLKVRGLNTGNNPVSITNGVISVDTSTKLATQYYVSTHSGSGMTYPSTTGIVTYNGSAWGTSITDNSANWNTAYTRSTNLINDSTKWNTISNTVANDSATWNAKLSSIDTSNITNFYSKVRSEFSFTAGSGAYNNATGLITIPTNTNQLTNGAGFITSATFYDSTLMASVKRLKDSMAALRAIGYLTSIDTSNISAFYTKVRSLHSVLAPLLYNSATGVESADTSSGATHLATQNYVTTRGYLSSIDTSNISNFYSKVRSEFSFTAGSGAYNNATGLITIPTNTNQLTNGAGFITSATFYDSTLMASVKRLKDSMAALRAIGYLTSIDTSNISAFYTKVRGEISLTTTGTSGAATWSNGTLNIPQYAGGGSGVTTIGTINSQSKSANGSVISGTTLYEQTADHTYPGLMSASDKAKLDSNKFLLKDKTYDSLAWKRNDSSFIIKSINIHAGSNVTVTKTITDSTSDYLIAASGGSGNMGIGNAITSATAGSLLYAGTGGILQQSNSKLFYDSANNRFAINTTIPSHTIDIRDPSGNVLFQVDSIGRASVGSAIPSWCGPGYFYTQGANIAQGGFVNGNGAIFSWGAGNVFLIGNGGGGTGDTLGVYTNNIERISIDSVVKIPGTLKANGLSFGYQTIATAAGTTTLTFSSPYYTMFTGSTTQTLVLPDATTLSVGFQFVIDNNSTGLVTINMNGGSNLFNIPQNGEVTLRCTAIGTSAGTWDVDYLGGVGVASGKFMTVNNSLTLAGTDATTMTFPSTSKTIAANDGSNLTISGQAIGDLAVASSTTAYGKLADVATGSVLVSGGTSTAPAWSATPSITTPSTTDNTTKVATTAFVKLAAQAGYATATALTPGTTVTWTPVVGTNVYTLTPAQTETINMGTVPGGCVGQMVYLDITTSGTTSYTLTFGTNIRYATSTLATGTTSAKKFLIAYLIESTTSVIELYRTVAE